MISNEKLKNYIQSANINFLIGSGISNPYLNTLGNIETWLTSLNDSEADNNLKSIIEASLYKMYFDDVIYRNYPNEISLNELFDDTYASTKLEYSRFLNIWNEILARRRSNILNKQINIFSTNIDLFMERAAEETGVEFNDGFRGRISPKFDEGNFLKSYSKVSSHFQNTSEIPVFNLLKVHGSIDWKSADKSVDIFCDSKLELVYSIKQNLKNIDSKFFVKIEKNDTIDTLEKKAQEILDANAEFSTDIFKDFISIYDKLVIINPTKRKFKETVLDLHFYELMRMFSNALEKENSILFVHGFSFADEHIAKIATRAADTNPTLVIIILAFKDDEIENYNKNLKLTEGKSKNDNIWIVSPQIYIDANSEGKETEALEAMKEIFQLFDFKTINALYENVGAMIPIRNYGK